MPGRDEESGLHHRGNDHWVGLNWLRHYLADASLTRQRSSCAINITISQSALLRASAPWEALANHDRCDAQDGLYHAGTAEQSTVRLPCQIWPRRQPSLLPPVFS
jgi:hypothetical protein